MKQLLLSLILLISFPACFSQTYDWIEKGGSATYDYGYGLATDVNGNSYLTGFFTGNASFGSQNVSSTSNVDQDVFIAKYDNLGNCLWVNSAGSPGDPDRGYAVAIDGAGNSFVTGFYLGTIDFGNQTLAPYGWDDMFIAKYDNNGNFVWAERYGGGGNDNGKDIIIDGAGNIYATGYFWSTANFSGNNISSGGWGDVFTAKFDANGTCQWVQGEGGVQNCEGKGIALDGAGNVYVTGFFKGSATFGSNNLTSNGDEDIYIAKYDNNGNLQWVNQVGSSGKDNGLAIASDIVGNVYVTGFFNGSATFGSTTLNTLGSDDIFLTRLDNQGNFIWAIRDGGNGIEACSGLVLNESSQIYVTGYFQGSADFGQGSITLNSNGGSDVFVASYDANGNFIWAKSAGGTLSDEGYGVGVDTSGNCYIGGYYLSTTAYFDNDSLVNIGFADAFAARIGPPNTSPTAIFTVNKNTICWDECANFYDNSTGAPTSWNWSFPGGNPSSSTQKNPTNICYTIQGTFDVQLIVSNGFGTDTLLIQDYMTVDSCTGIQENAVFRNVAVYPNPTTGLVEISITVKEATTVMLSLSHINGQLVRREELELKPGINRLPLDMRKTATGVYHLQLANEHGTYSKMIVRN